MPSLLFQETLLAMETATDDNPCLCGSGKQSEQCCLPSGVTAHSTRAPRAAVPELLLLAWKNHEAGRLPEAESLYKAILGVDPDHVDALRSLGVLAHSAHKYDAAIDLIRKAIGLDPSNAQSHVNLADALKKKGEFDAAIASYHTAIALSPKFVAAYDRLAATLLNRADYADAAQIYQHLLEINPDNANAHQNLGLALAAQSKFDEAVECYRRAISLKPDSHEIHNNLANVLVKQEKFDSALESCREAIALKKDFHPATVTLGNILFLLGKTDEAVKAYRHSISLVPDALEAHHNLATILSNTGRYAEAAECLSRVIAIKPNYFNGYDCLLFLQHYDEKLTAQDNLAMARRYGEAVMAGVTPYLHGRVSERGASNRPLRVGFVSGDLHTHPVGIFLENVLAHLDATKVELVAYSLTHAQDDVTTRIKPYFSAWKSLLDLTPEKSARIIHDDGIDILIDLSGHTAKTGLPLFAWKPAPIQATWIGYFATTGVPTVDYIIGDRYVLPEDEEHHFVEKPWRLPDGYLCFTPPLEDVSVGPLPMLASGQITFGCFNKLSKMNEVVVTLWARVIKAVPKSRLMLKSHELDTESTRDETLKRFAAQGIRADQLILSGRSDRHEYMAQYSQIDIALDPFPYNGGTTTVETLWMGVPVIARHGDRFVAHMGEGILHHIGHPEWIAQTDNDYVAIAAALASDPAHLAKVRSGLRAQLQSSPICDAPRFAKKLEAAFEEMWQIHCAQAPVNPIADIAAKLEAAIKYQQESRFQDAEHLYRAILQIQPNHPYVNQNLGVLAIQRGRPTESLAFFRTALQAAPKNEEFWAVYIEALISTGNPEAAERALQQGRQLDLRLEGIQVGGERSTPVSVPQEVQALVAEFVDTLIALQNGGMHEDLLSVARQMTQMFPDHAYGWKVLGSTLLQQGQYTDALAPLQTAAALSPGDAELCSNLGQVTALYQARRLAEILLERDDIAAGRRIVSELRAAGWGGPEIEALTHALDLRAPRATDVPQKHKDGDIMG
jgi:protein O-GlcNAc transferase